MQVLNLCGNVRACVANSGSLCSKKVDYTIMRYVYIEAERGREKHAKGNQMQTELWKLSDNS